MHEQDHLAARFEADRTHLRAVAYRMLGSVAEAEDAVQEAWFRLSRTDTTDVANLTGWLTTVVGRVCLDQLRARRARPEDAAGERLPDPVVRPLPGGVAAVAAPDPAAEAELADSVGLALLVVLDSLAPAERLAYVLHDMFGLPFDEIAPMVDRSPEATRQLASRARRRIQGKPVVAEGDQEREGDRVVERDGVGRVDGDAARGHRVVQPRLGQPDAGDLLPAGASGAQGVQAHAAHDGGQPGQRLADRRALGLVQPVPAQQCLGDGVLGVVCRAEHPVGDGPQVGPVGLESLRQPLVVVRR